MSLAATSPAIPSCLLPEGEPKSLPSPNLFFEFEEGVIDGLLQEVLHGDEVLGEGLGKSDSPFDVGDLEFEGFDVFDEFCDVDEVGGGLFMGLPVHFVSFFDGVDDFGDVFFDQIQDEVD